MRKENTYVNHEGYYDPTAGKAIENTERMPTKIYEIYKALSHVASLHGLEIMGLRDCRTGKVWRRQNEKKIKGNDMG